MAARFLSILILPALFLALPAAADAPRLMMPVACTVGEQCWVVNYVDMDPGSDDASDYTCGARSYDGHEGTDFGLRDRAAMNDGVSVLAAAPGKVLRVRDTMPDDEPAPEEIERMLAENRGCGNGILIDHGKGWQSIYCHLKQGSIVVKPNDTVRPGQQIAQVGQSGAAEFPHLHFGLFHNNRTVDPFSGSFAEDGCGKMQGALWMDGLRLDYEPMAVFATGFASGVPDFNALRADIRSPRQLRADVPALTFWAGFFGLRIGDTVTMEILNPDGSIFATRTVTQETDRARQFYFVGRRATEILTTGEYRGRVRIERAIKPGADDTLSRDAEATLTVTSAESGGALLP